MAIVITVNQSALPVLSDPTWLRLKYSITLSSIVKLHTLCICLPYRLSGNLLYVCGMLEPLGASIKHRTPSLHAKAYINNWKMWSGLQD